MTETPAPSNTMHTILVTHEAMVEIASAEYTEKRFDAVGAAIKEYSANAGAAELRNQSVRIGTIIHEVWYGLPERLRGKIREEFNLLAFDFAVVPHILCVCIEDREIHEITRTDIALSLNYSSLRSGPFSAQPSTSLTGE